MVKEIELRVQGQYLCGEKLKALMDKAGFKETGNFDFCQCNSMPCQTCVCNYYRPETKDGKDKS